MYAFKLYGQSIREWLNSLEQYWLEEYRNIVAYTSLFTSDNHDHK